MEHVVMLISQRHPDPGVQAFIGSTLWRIRSLRASEIMAHDHTNPKNGTVVNTI